MTLIITNDSPTKQLNIIYHFKYVFADSLYGTSPEFFEALGAYVGTTYFAEAPADTGCWLKRPITREKQCQYKGEIRSRSVLEKTEKKELMNQTDHLKFRCRVS